MDRWEEEFEKWHGEPHFVEYNPGTHGADITDSCRTSFRAGFERAVELAAKECDEDIYGCRANMIECERLKDDNGANRWLCRANQLASTASAIRSLTASPEKDKGT